MPVQPSAARPLSTDAVADVLRYWHASLRMEEALSARPRARTSGPTSTAPRLDTPSPGQDYFKLPLDSQVEPLIQRGGGVLRPFDGELCAFFEHYLHDQYRRGGEDEGHLLCFPVIVMPRGELLSLLRLPIGLRFMDEQKGPFSVPTRRQRTRKEFPAAPSQVHITRKERAEGDFPFFLDTRVLHQQLGVDSATIDELFSALREDPRLTESRMLATLLRFLNADMPEQRPAPADDAALVSEVTEVVRERLSMGGAKMRAYPFGIVVSAAQTKVTWHLQQDITQLLRNLEQAELPRDAPLAHYLGGDRAVAQRGLQRALADGPALTAVQRDVAEHFWGSRLTSVQGPPGTGKTTLIQHLAAEFLLRKVEGLTDHGTMGSETLTLVSSNNRAVDNALGPFLGGQSDGQSDASEDDLPLALRAGSRQACEHVLMRQLRRAAVFLTNAQAIAQADRDAALDEASAHFRAVRSTVTAGLVDRAAAMAQHADHAAVARELSRLPKLPARKKNAKQPLPEAYVLACKGLEKRLEELSELCEARPSVATLSTVARHFDRTRKRQLADFELAATDAGKPLRTKLPPDLPPSIEPKVLMECWQSATERALDELAAVLAEQDDLKAAAALSRKHDALKEKLERLGEPTPVPEGHASEEDMRALFSAAKGVLRAWARCESERLGSAVERTLAVVGETRSLRGLYRDEPETWAALRQLFGLWGSTLLSLGNGFPGHAEAISRVIIDEAGQCHPAHAVSGLMRCHSALVIGDVHQLPPVIELTLEDDRRVVQQAARLGSAAPAEEFRVNNQTAVSAQALADRSVEHRLRLVDHFRCQPEIIDLCDQLSHYELRVHTKARSLRGRVPSLSAPVLFWDVVGEQQRMGGSLYNTAELSATHQLLDRLLSSGISPSDIAVITPFRGQLERLRQLALSLGIPLEASTELSEIDSHGASSRMGLAIGTVHRFQGGERSIVLFSTTASRRRSLGFLNEQPNLLNVAISRAKDHLVCIGNRALASEGRVTSVLADNAATFLF